MSCCSNDSSDKKPAIASTGCCNGKVNAAAATCSTEKANQNSQTTSSCCDTKARRDYLLWGSLTLVITLYFISFLNIPVAPLQHAAHSVFELLNTMAWGVAVGVIMVAVLAKVPREWVMAILGTNAGFKGLLRATAAGVLLDLCSHGILMVGAKLYERGATLGQLMAFLIASPWNSFSLTLIMVALIGLKWTITFIVLSLVIAIIAGWLFDACVKRGILPANPNTQKLPVDFKLWPAVKNSFSQFSPSAQGTVQFLWEGLTESRMVIRWLLVGVLLAAAIRAFVPEEIFGTYFGPTLLGLGITLVAATILEICSEGSTPIAADIFNRAAAPGNSFAFLMAGIATDYTEVMVIKSTTRSWKIALFLPLLVLPQVVLFALLLNAI